MLTQLHIENFKSIHNLDIELGKINVFIGENGCGKSNILEAVALASAASENRLKNDDFVFHSKYDYSFLYLCCSSLDKIYT